MKTTTEPEPLPFSWKGSWKTISRYGAYITTLEDERKANIHLPLLSKFVRETDELLEDIAKTMKKYNVDY